MDRLTNECFKLCNGAEAKLAKKAVEVMRLIDADKLLHMDYEDAMNYIEHGCDYDPDKVVEALEEKYAESKHYFDEECEMSAYGEMHAYDIAIEIVKKGGVK